MSFSEEPLFRVGDIVEHTGCEEGAPSVEPRTPQGKGLIVGAAKRNIDPHWNSWKIEFFNGRRFEVAEGYLKKVQGTVDTRG